MASLELLKVGAECEVLEPAELRKKIAETSDQVSRVYGAARRAKT